MKKKNKKEDLKEIVDEESPYYSRLIGHIEKPSKEKKELTLPKIIGKENSLEDSYEKMRELFNETYKKSNEEEKKELEKLKEDIKNDAEKIEKNPEGKENYELIKEIIEKGTKTLKEINEKKDKENEEKIPEEDLKKEEEKIPEEDLKKEEETPKEILESYELDVDGAIVKIKIEKGNFGILYNLEMPELGTGTKALLENIKEEIISSSTIGAGEMVDSKRINFVKKQFLSQTGKLLKEKVPSITPKKANFFASILMQEMLGLGEIEFLINDSNLEEIVVINSKEPVRVYFKKYGWLSTNIKIKKEEDINNYSNIIARRVGRQINLLTPLLDAHIVTGDRANAVLYPVATKGNTITIRKFARDPWTIVDLINNKTVSLDVAAIVWTAIEAEMNILISGGTASGKTVFLNACMPFVPPNQRLISIEDTRELMLPEFLYWCPLVTRTPNPEGKGEVSMLDLLINSLRMRPDRIILGEMRRQREAEVLFEAMHTGHSVYATVHADTAAETISRLTNPPLSIPPNLLKAVNLNVVMFRNRRKGVRRVYQVA